MSQALPSASVIVRVKDEADTLERTLELLREQTTETEIVVVDSGSRDGSLEVAKRFCDRLVQIPPEEFTYGHALNVGAQAASGEVHFAISAHCHPARRDWVERALGHYDRPDVAGTGGARMLPDGGALTEPLALDLDAARRRPFWGFSNHASSWRASVWREQPFNERMPACEDREWSFRVLSQGWRIVVDPLLYVSTGHRRDSGVRALFRRTRGETEALAAFADLPPFGLARALRAWWGDLPAGSRHRPILRRLNYLRATELAGRWAGQRRAARAAAR